MARRRRGRPVSGWLCLDKPDGLTSTQAVGRVRRLFGAAKAGHAGTLDPLATGILPIALGEATKTVSDVQAAEKVYRFTVRWGEETDTDDSEGQVTRTAETRPSDEAVRALLPSFTGTIMQRPPAFSAVKVDGQRAYDLAREGEQVSLDERPVTIARLELCERPDADHAVLECVCGAGTYVRALARDIGRDLDCLGHVATLRRTRVGPFDEAGAVPLADLEAAASEAETADRLDRLLLPLGHGLSALPQIAVGADDAARLGRGQAVLMRGRDAPVVSGRAHVTHAGRTVAIGEVKQGAIHPRRVFADVS